MFDSEVWNQTNTVMHCAAMNSVFLNQELPPKLPPLERYWPVFELAILGFPVLGALKRKAGLQLIINLAVMTPSRSVPMAFHWAE